MNKLHSNTEENVFKAIGDSISLLFGGIGGMGVAMLLFKAILLPALGAAIGAFVGFYVNRWLKKKYDESSRDDKGVSK